MIQARHIGSSSLPLLNDVVYRHDHRFEDKSPEIRVVLDRGKTCISTKDYKQAQQLFLEAVSMDREHPEARGWLALSYGLMLESSSLMNKMKLLPKFEKETKAALQLSPNWTFVRRINGMKLLNTPDQFGGNPIEALEELLFCIEHGFDNFEINLAVSQAYMKLCDFPRAITYLEKASAIEPGNPKAVKQLELIHLNR